MSDVRLTFNSMPSIVAVYPKMFMGSKPALVPDGASVPGLAQRVNPNMVLFLFARTPGAAGPPLAVVRHVAGELPLSVNLGQDNVMLANTVLADHDELQLVARISQSGSPGAQPGDLFGEVLYRTGSGAVDLLIDQVVP